ncbi:MAG: hypothetical protein GKR96_01335 [Gammaproteobacteria bacterium]|nr:hypothetical protein [Gammaproteobacteria bacterium]
MNEESVSCLYEELDEWNFIGEEATFWWRDDDAQASTPELEKLLNLSSRFSVPISLAVIPDNLDSSLKDCIDKNFNITVLQHGFSHRNHAEVHQKKQELGNHRMASEIFDELRKGMSKLQSHFGDAFCPILVPPWNRIDFSLVSSLPKNGYKGVSTFKPRACLEPEHGLWVVNTHADIMSWKKGKRFIGETSVVEQLVTHLKSRREGACDSTEPTGLLTHHLVHDVAAWQFLNDLIALMDEHPAVKWMDAKSIFQTRWR